MKVIVPNKDLKLLNSSIEETDAADGTAWDASATYAAGAKVRHEHIRYESLADNNKGNNPAETYSGTNAKWKPLGATMPYLMLDEYVETQTVGKEGQVLSFTVPFNRATAFALLNVEGYTARVTVSDDEDGEEYYASEYFLIRDISAFSLWEYNYTPIESRINLVVTDIPMPITGTMQVEIDPGEGSIARLGLVVVGLQQMLGKTQYGAEVGITDYSFKQVNDFGVATLVRRSYADTMSLPLYLHPNRMDYVGRILKDIRTTPCVFVGDNRDEGHQSLTVYGWVEDWRSVYSGPNEQALTLEIQGLI